MRRTCFFWSKDFKSGFCSKWLDPKMDGSILIMTKRSKTVHWCPNFERHPTVVFLCYSTILSDRWQQTMDLWVLQFWKTARKRSETLPSSIFSVGFRTDTAPQCWIWWMMMWSSTRTCGRSYLVLHLGFDRQPLAVLFGHLLKLRYSPQITSNNHFYGNNHPLSIYNISVGKGDTQIPNPCILKFRSRKGRSRKTAEGEVQHRLFNILLWNTSILEVRDEHVK